MMLNVRLVVPIILPQQLPVSQIRRTVANLEQTLLPRSFPVITWCAWSCSWSVVFDRSSCVCVLGLSTLILVLSTAESWDFNHTMYKEVCPSWV